ncbi:menaquinol oxidoreductase [Oceanidesulfovibrio indonesiensis]|uniref:Menaquinol oxidoreductase n=1 Tax=Oceanidesulfovibrio indonesiensis TaxID=54767 RepID=A0A7M3MED0_9BACT|nr:sulfate reduction electron transfer complex DsrMKJOP subunit DsrM [Oceanidesulfovibrio indonesiensis]TVM16830.1 menaquinol oxidoreductase [Oceanidesulfovibrio indonesiensis]
MSFFISFLLVLAFGSLAYLGVESGYKLMFAAIIPYVAVGVFVFGFVYKLIDWARSPVPFRIPTTGGQQKSLDWIKTDYLDNPPNKGWTVGRMILEILTFRSLFRNTSMNLRWQDGEPRVVYYSEKWLWLFALAFHYCFLVIFIRHFRFFMEPVPLLVQGAEFFDGILEIGAPRLYQTDLIIIAALLFLLLRRIFDNKVRYISLLSDYFPLFLLLSIVGTGLWMRYFAKTDIVGVKQMTMSLVQFNPVIVDSVGAIFYMHLFFVSILLIYFPFSKLMHMGGVFLSPTRNLPNDSRMKHHVNPWNPPKKYHTYEAYEDDFREVMVEAGLPVEKQPEETPETKAEAE